MIIYFVFENSPKTTKSPKNSHLFGVVLRGEEEFLKCIFSPTYDILGA